MKNTLAVTALVALVTVSTPVLVWGADTASDAERAKRQAAVFPTLQEAAAAAAGYKKTSIEVKSTAHQVTIAVVNSKLNDAIDNRAHCRSVDDRICLREDHCREIRICGGCDHPRGLC